MTIFDEIRNQGSGQMTIAEIMKMHNHLGIPHFQRGLVWGNESIASLLESLYYKTPCGSFVLWKPLNPTVSGKPLPYATSLDYLILDGQQRIRSLSSIFLNRNVGDPDSNGQAEDMSSDDHHIWCVNIAKIPEMREYFDEPQSDRPLFRYLTNIWKPGNEGADIAKDTDNSNFKNNHIPLNLFLYESNKDLVWDHIKTKNDNKDVGAILSKLNTLKKEKFQKLWHERFFVVIKEETGNENSMAEMIRLYNRINSGGKRVESEERSFASLISLYPKTSDHINTIFNAIHKSSPLSSLDMDRDDMMSRRKERNFGFKLFIRIFIQVCNYHFGYSLGSNALSFDFVNSATFQKYFSDPANHDKIESLWNMTEGIIRYTHKLITQDLFCDNLQFLPDTTSLLPLIQCLIQFPKLMTDASCAAKVQSIALRLMLAELTPREGLKLAAEIRDNRHTAEDIIVIILEKLNREFLKNKLRERLKYSNSLMDRYTLLLYWLERRNGARDLAYINIKDANKRNTLISMVNNAVTRYYGPNYAEIYDSMYKLQLSVDEQTSPFIDESLSPEKQHLVPYSALKSILNIEDKTRLSSHEANNIGNITYISRLLNSVEYGVGSHFIKMGKESPSQMGAHFFTDGKRGSRLLNIFKDIEYRKEDQKKAETLFRRFYMLRYSYIAEGFLQWIDDLDHKSIVLDRYEAEIPLFIPEKDLRVTQRIRLFNYDNQIEDILIRIQLKMGLKVQNGLQNNDDCRQMVLSKSKDNKLSITMNEKGLVIKINSHNLLDDEKLAIDALECFHNNGGTVVISNVKSPDVSVLELLKTIETVLRPESKKKYHSV